MNQPEVCKGEFVTKSFFTLMVRLVLVVISMLASILTARILGPSGKGEFAVILLAPTLLLSLGGIAISSSNVYFIGGKKYKLNEIFWNSTILSILLGGFLVGVFLLIFPWARGFFQNADRRLLYIAVLTVPVSLFFAFGSFIPLGQRKVIVYNLLKIVEPFFYLVALIVLLWWFKLGVPGAVWSYIAAVVITSLIFAGYAIRKIPLEFGLNLELGKITSVYAIKCHLGNTTWFLTRRIAILLVNRFLAPAEVGYYVIAVTVSEALWHLPTAISIILFPEVCSIQSSADKIKMASRVSRNSLFILAGAAGVLGIAAHILIKALYGVAYLPSVAALWILLPGSVLLGVHVLLATYINGIGRPILPSIVTSGMLVLTVLLNVVMIPEFGFRGAALAMTLTYASGCLAMMVMYRKLTGERWKNFLIVSRDDIAYYLELIIGKFRRLKAARTNSR